MVYCCLRCGGSLRVWRFLEEAPLLNVNSVDNWDFPADCVVFRDCRLLWSVIVVMMRFCVEWLSELPGQLEWNSW
jgi:hypothetical protein